MDAYRPLRLATWTLLAFAVAFVTAGLLGWGPPAANEQAIGAVSRWCERVAGGLLREPVNTLGNLGFVAVGLAMFRTLARDEVTGRAGRSPFHGNQPIALLYAGASLFLGPGSMVMHGSHTFFGAWLDNVSMVAYILVPWLVNLAALARWSTSTILRVHGAVLALYATLYWLFGADLGIGMDLFGLSIALWMITEVLHRAWSPVLRWASGLVGFLVALVFGITPAAMAAAPGDYWWVVLFWLPAVLATGPADTVRRYVPWFWAGTASFLVAFAIWQTGTAESATCEPDSPLQAHALWHLLSAVATWSFFRFLRTTRATPVVALTGERHVRAHGA